jgi:hypothetical protein
MLKGMLTTGLSATRATAHWTLFFAVAFAATAGVLLLAHV